MNVTQLIIDSFLASAGLCLAVHHLKKDNLWPAILLGCTGIVNLLFGIAVVLGGK
jgi:hypothetical protein